jgi:DNA primase
LLSESENIIDIVGARVRLKKVGIYYVACCPFHKESTPSFSVNDEKQEYHCFGCGAQGNANDFIKAFDDMVTHNNSEELEETDAVDTRTRVEILEAENKNLKSLVIHLLNKENK